MYVRARLEEGIREQALLIPQQGVTHDAQGNPTALLLGDDQKVVLRQLTVNRAIGDQWLIDSGVKVGDRVIVDGLQGVKPGVTAHVMSAAAVATADTTKTASPGNDQ
jgi:membrane fusion protein (multidrug efflux system)